jgi:hypothetical protein
MRVGQNPAWGVELRLNVSSLSVQTRVLGGELEPLLHLIALLPRENKDWLIKATNWAKYSVIGSLGVIHKGHVAQAQTVLGPYLPQDGAAGSPYEVCR